jgi:nicotinamidase-related amidase
VQTALLLIDVQQSFAYRPYWRIDDVPAFLAHCNALVAGCITLRVPVLRIFHTDGPRTADSSFAPESGPIRPLDGLALFDTAATFEKHRHDALVGTGLLARLFEKHVGRSPRAHLQSIRTALAERAVVAGMAPKHAIEAAGISSDRQWRCWWLKAAPDAAPGG